MKRILCVILMVCLLAPFAFADEAENLARYNSEKKDPGTAALWSLAVLGGGQVYHGNWIKAGLLWVVTSVCFSQIYLALTDTSIDSGAYGLLFMGSWLYSIYDASAEARDINQKLRTKYGLSSIQLLDPAKIPYALIVITNP